MRRAQRSDPRIERRRVLYGDILPEDIAQVLHVLIEVFVRSRPGESRAYLGKALVRLSAEAHKIQLLENNVALQSSIAMRKQLLQHLLSAAHPRHIKAGHLFTPRIGLRTCGERGTNLGAGRQKVSPYMPRRFVVQSNGMEILSRLVIVSRIELSRRPLIGAVRLEQRRASDWRSRGQGVILHLAVGKNRLLRADPIRQPRTLFAPVPSAAGKSQRSRLKRRTRAI